MVHRPAILIADEPTGNLEAVHAVEIGELFRSFNQVGVTVVIATHDVAFAARLKPRLIALSEENSRHESLVLQHRGRARDHGRSASAHPVATLLNLGVIGVALALRSTLTLVSTHLGLGALAASDPQLSVFLALDAAGRSGRKPARA